MMQEVVEAILKELTGRSGFDHAWDSCDGPTQDAVRAALVKIVEDHLPIPAREALHPLAIVIVPSDRHLGGFDVWGPTEGSFGFKEDAKVHQAVQGNLNYIRSK